MSKITMEQKKLLEPFGNVFADMGRQVRALSDEDLQEMFDACYATTVTNCWCCTWDASRYLLNEVRGELLQRKQRAEAAHSA
jgi:hypothetical protein